MLLRSKESNMAKKKKGSGRSKSRRASLKSFAKGKFQSPVHSDGFKQDVLIDTYGGDKGVSAASANVAAKLAGQAGKTYFKYGGTTYKAVAAGRGYTAQSDDRTGKVK